MKKYFIFENQKYYINENLPIKTVILLSDSIISDIFGQGRNVALYIKDYVIKYYIIKNIISYPLPDDLQESWELIKCKKLWNKLNRTGILRSPFYKKLLEDIDKQIEYEILKYANKPDFDAVLEGIDFDELIKTQLAK